MPSVINSHNKTTFIIFLLMPLLFLASGNIYGKVTQETVNEMVLKALKSGINFIDTAPWYGQGVSEERLGVALENVPREKYFIATKVTSTSFSAFKDFPKLSFLSLQVGRYQIEPLNEMFDFSVDKVERSVKDSLQKLGLSYVDLIQVHLKIFLNFFRVEQKRLERSEIGVCVLRVCCVMSL